MEARLRHAVSNDGDRPHYLRGILEAGVFTPLGQQESHALFGLSRANALLLIPPHTEIAPNETATAFTWH
jgi:molybdopterin molybdotransferase